MTVTSKISRSKLATWAEREAFGDNPAGRATTRDYGYAALVLENPHTVRHLGGERLSNLVGRIGWMLGWVTDESSARRIELGVACLTAAPDFLEFHYSETDVDVFGLYMFWDHARNFWNNRPAALQSAMFDALTRQLQVRNVWVQNSALHGFGHLKDPRAQPIIAEFIESCDVDWLREYAKTAMRFEVL